MKSYFNLTEEEKFKISKNVCHMLEENECKNNAFQYELKSNSLGWLLVYLNGHIYKRYDIDNDKLIELY